MVRKATSRTVCVIYCHAYVFMRVRVAGKKALGNMTSSTSQREMEMKTFFTVNITKRYMIYGKDQRGWYNLPTNTTHTTPHIYT